MTVFIPLGYVAFREAARDVEAAMFQGLSDQPLVARLRSELGMEVGDLNSQHQAIKALWSAIDRGQVRLMAIGGHPRKIVRFNPELTKEIPLMRHPSVGDLTYLRSSHRRYGDLIKWFGSAVDIALMVRENEIRQLCKQVRATRRRKSAASPRAGRGRPSSQKKIQPLIKQIVAKGRWTTVGSIKALRKLIEQELGGSRISDDSVIRALHRIHFETGDRAFARRQRRRRR